jgi:hypothetical protein
MSNKNKKEPTYLFNEMKLRFVKEENGYWLMTRIKDGYRLYLKPDAATLIDE